MSELSTRQRWIVLAASLAVGLAFLDETAVVTALRAIQHDFSATSVEVQWVMGGYLLALAFVDAGGGTLADLYGCRRLFLIGATPFGVGSIVAPAARGPLGHGRPPGTIVVLAVAGSLAQHQVAA